MYTVTFFLQYKQISLHIRINMYITLSQSKKKKCYLVILSN